MGFSYEFGPLRQLHQMWWLERDVGFEEDENLPESVDLPTQIVCFNAISRKMELKSKCENLAVAEAIVVILRHIPHMYVFDPGPRMQFPPIHGNNVFICLHET